MKNIAILGSTGSIGTQTLDIVDGSDGEVNVVALSAGRNIKLIEEQTRKYRPELICVHNEDDAAELAVRLKDIDVKIRVSRRKKADCVKFYRTYRAKSSKYI